MVTVVEAIVKRLIPATGSRLSYLRELEQADEKGWLLSTSELADRLGLSPRTIVSYEKEFEDAGKIFTRAGIRKGGEVANGIDKIFSLYRGATAIDPEARTSFLKGVRPRPRLIFCLYELTV